MGVAKRSALVLPVALLLLGAFTALLFVPLATCPDCAAAMEVHRKSVQLPSFVNLGCPRCDDAGKVGGLNRWTRRRLDPDLSSLILAAWKDELGSQHDFEAPFRRLAERSGLRPDLDDFYYGQTVFVDDGRDLLLAAHTRSGGPRGHPVRLSFFLYDRGGAVLDHLAVDCPGPPGEVSSLWSTGSRELRSFTLGHPKAAPLTFRIVRKAGESTVNAPMLRLRARRGRFEIDPP